MASVGTSGPPLSEVVRKGFLGKTAKAAKAPRSSIVSCLGHPRHKDPSGPP